MKEDLQRIANTLILYSYHINDNGLLAGRTGIIWFLYRYSKYVGNEYYSRFADELLDKVLNTSENMTSDFENGLSGIGWTINRLLKEELVDGNPNEVLERVDHRVFECIMCNPEVSLFGQAIYLKERLKDNIGNPYFEEQINKVLYICMNGFENFDGKISLYHINSVLSFLIEINKLQKYHKKVEAVRQLLPQILKKIMKQQLFDFSDNLIFNQLLNNKAVKLQSDWQQIKAQKFLCPPNNADPIELYIRTAWMQELYFNKIEIETPPIALISKFIDCKQTSITIKDFLFAKGLAGLGCALLASQG